MMAKFTTSSGTMARIVAFAGAAAAAACTANLAIDDFSTSPTTHVNTLGSWTSDDGSMMAIGPASPSAGRLSMKPGTGYYYETWPCLSARAAGYDAVQFNIAGPADTSFTLELQSASSCADISKRISTTTVISGVNPGGSNVRVPLSMFAGANLDAIIAVSWSAFSNPNATITLDNLVLTCAGGGASSSSVSGTSKPVSSQPSSSGASKPISSQPTSSQPQATNTSGTLSQSSTSNIPTGSPSKAFTSTSTNIPTTKPVTSSVLTSSPPPPSSVPSTLSTRTTSALPSPTAPGTCKLLLIDDFMSQSRLTFLGYNALIKAAADDGTMKSLVVANNRLTITPKNSEGYYFNNLGCLQAASAGWGGMSMRIKAPAGSQVSIQFVTLNSCGGTNESYFSASAAELGWRFDGTEKLYSAPFSAFKGLVPNNLQSVLIAGLSQPITVGPMALYCGSQVAEYMVPRSPSPFPITYQGAPPASTNTTLLVDTFKNANSNNLGFYHGADDGFPGSVSNGVLTVRANGDADLAWYTQLTDRCRDLSGFAGGYLHIAYSGSTKFTIALMQHNSACNETIAPYPETWDSLDASRYASNSNSDIYIPMSHFKINLKRAIGFSLKGFYSKETTTFRRIEIVPSVPQSWRVPTKLPSGQLMFACKRPNSFAFAIDDGIPELAQQVVEIIRSEGIKVTFFTVGLPLEDPETRLGGVYSQMLKEGHQVALHTYTHPPMEGLPTIADIDWEYTKDINATRSVLGPAGFTEHMTHYFRPPFGTEGARMRSRYAAIVNDPNAYIVQWSVDVEDWLWAMSPTPEKQLEAFQRDVNKGGNLVVLHYLYPSTVSYLRQFIQIAKKTGKQLMRVDQCMEDPMAPPL